MSIFLSRHIDPCADVTNVALLDSNGYPIGPTDVVIEATQVPNEIDGQYSCIGIQLMCHMDIHSEVTKESLGYHRYNTIGGGALYLSEILDNPKKTFRIELRDRSLEDEYDGISPRIILAMKIVAIEIDKITISGSHDPKEYSRQEDILNDIQERFLDAFRRRLKPTIPGARNKHVPKYITSVSGLKLPACSFVMVVSNERCREDDVIDLMIHCVRIVAGMNGWEESDVYTTIKSQFDNNESDISDEFVICCKMIGEALCLISNCCDYVFDLAQGKDIERFIDVTKTLSGDCEDTGRLPVELHAILYESEISYTHNKHMYMEDRDTKAALLTSWAKLYISLLCTATATLPAMKSNTYDDGNTDDLICHVYGLCLPRLYFCSTLPYDMQSKAKNGCEIDRTISNWEKSKRIPTLVLEGTNFSVPIQVPLHISMKSTENRNFVSRSMRKYNEARNKLENRYINLKKFSILTPQDNTHAESVYSISEEKFSSFYRRIVGAWSWTLLRWGINVADLSIGYSKQTYSTLDGGYAVDFRDINSQSPKITLVPTFEFSDRELDVINNALMQEPPFVTDWVIPVNSIFKDVQNELTKKILSENAYARELDGIATVNVSIKKGKRMPFVPSFISYRLNHINKLDKSMLDAIKGALKNKMIDSIEWFVHPLTRDMELYIVDFRLYLPYE